jgi:hypothetical protein
VDSNVIDYLLIQFFCIGNILEEKWHYTEIVYHSFIGFKRAYDSVMREIL